MALIGSLTTTGSMQSLVVNEARWKVANDNGAGPGSVSLVIQTGDFGNAHQQNASGSIIFVGKDGGATNRAGSIVSKPYTNQDLVFSSSQSHSDIRFSVLDGSSRFNLLTITSGRRGGGLTAHRGPKVFITDTAGGYDKDTTLPYRGGGLLTVSTQTDQVGIQIIHTGTASEAALEIKKKHSGANTTDSLFSVKPSETVVNDAQGDYDFRVESDNETNMLYVDGTNNRVGIANNAPMGALDINNRGTSNWSIILRNNDNSGAASTYGGIRTNSNGVIILSGTNGKVFMNAGKHSVNENSELFLVSKTDLDGGGNHGESRLWFSRMAANEAITQYAYMGYDHANSLLKLGVSSTFGAKERVTMGSAAVIINEDAEDVNFRIESDTKTNAFFMDGSNGKIQIGDDTTTGLGNYSDVTLSRTDTSTQWDSRDQSANQIDHMSLFLRNQSNTERTFTGIGFDTGTEIDLDSIGAAIIAERDGTAHADSTKHDTNLLFATSYGTDDQLTERVRITHDGNIYFRRMDNPATLTFVRDDAIISSANGLGEIVFSGNEGSNGLHHQIISGTVYQSAKISCASASSHGPGSRSGYLSFSTTAVEEDTVTENMRIQADGTIGIASDLYHLGDTDTYVSFTTDQIDFYAGNVKMLTLDESTADNIVFNEGGADVNFRVESSGQAYAIYAEGGNGKVQFGGDANVTGGTGRVIISDASLDATADTSDPTNYHLMIHGDQSSNGVGAGIGFAVATDNDDIGGAIIFNRTGSESKGELLFYTKQSTTDAYDPSLVMAMTDDGKVGINNSAPQSDLSVSVQQDNASPEGPAICFDWVGGSVSLSHQGAPNDGDVLGKLHATATWTPSVGGLQADKNCGYLMWKASKNWGASSATSQSTEFIITGRNHGASGNAYILWGAGGDSKNVILNGSSDPYDSTTSATNYAVSAGSFIPAVDNSVDLGKSFMRWDDVYATNSTINTSDRNLKEQIVDSNLGLDFICRLNPVSYKWKDTVQKYYTRDEDTDEKILVEEEKTHSRIHYGLIAQDVEEVMTTLGMTRNDFAGFCANTDQTVFQSEPVETLGLRYNEFISPLIKAVQELKSENDDLKARIEALEA